MKTLFKVITGSRAHGLNTLTSDYDYRGVFIVPTADILSINKTSKQTTWLEGDIDDTAWELGHFLHLATKCNPTVLEVFLSPITQVAEEDSETVDELRALFPHVWNSQYVRDAFIGYSHNQRKKLLDDKDGRKQKYAAAYLRVLYQAAELLNTGTFTIRIADTPIGEYIRAVKFAGTIHAKETDSRFDLSTGAIIDRCNELELEVHRAFAKNPDKKTDYDKVNAFLIKTRLANMYENN